MGRPLNVAVLCALWWSAACSRQSPPVPPPAPLTAARALKKPRVELTVLATAQEGRGLERAERLLAQWRAKEGHCPDGACSTLAVSTGGHAGPASSLLARLGYAASAFGPAEQEALSQGIPLPPAPPHLAANLPEAPAGVEKGLVVERAGLSFYLLGVSAGVLPDGGVDLGSAWSAMQREIPASWNLAPATLVVSDLCVKDLATILENNARAWPFLVAVVGNPCGPPPPPRHIYSVLLVAATEGLEGYGRATLSFDQHTAALLKAEGENVLLAP